MPEDDVLLDDGLDENGNPKKVGDGDVEEDEEDEETFGDESEKVS